MLLRARIVLPVSSPAIADGAVFIAEDRVADFGPWRDLSSRYSETPVDLGDVILLPGLINAHCHLDYTEMAGQPAPKQFPDWIKGLLARKAAASYTEYAHAWIRGATMLLHNGVTTVADIEAVPELLPEVWSSTTLRVVSFLEMTCVRSRREPRVVIDQASAKIESLHPERGFVGLSPHALYSTNVELLRGAAEMARERTLRLTTHVAESIDEFEMYVNRRGPLFDWLKSQRDMSDCGHGSPLQQLRECGLLGPNFLAVHANYLLPEDIAALAQSHSSVVHCPRSHAYFRHQRFPFDELAVADVNVCLGTDSLASVAPTRFAPELNLFTEMQLFAVTNPAMHPAAIVGMATIHGARALGLVGRLGEITSGAFADLITVPFNGRMEDAFNAVVQHKGVVSNSMIDGKWAFGQLAESINE